MFVIIIMKIEWDEEFGWKVVWPKFVKIRVGGKLWCYLMTLCLPYQTKIWGIFHSLCWPYSSYLLPKVNNTFKFHIYIHFLFHFQSQKATSLLLPSILSLFLLTCHSLYVKILILFNSIGTPIFFFWVRELLLGDV